MRDSALWPSKEASATWGPALERGRKSDRKRECAGATLTDAVSPGEGLRMGLLLLALRVV